VRATRSEPGQRDVDDVRVDGPDVVVTKAEAVHDTGAVVLDDHIGPGCEATDDVDAFRRMEVDGDRSLPPVADEVEGAHAVHGDADPAGDVTDRRALDLDDL